MSLWDLHAARFVVRGVRVVSDLPQMSVGIGDVTGIPTPGHRLRRLDSHRSRRDPRLEDGIDLGSIDTVQRQRDTAEPLTVSTDLGIVGERLTAVPRPAATPRLAAGCTRSPSELTGHHPRLVVVLPGLRPAAVAPSSPAADVVRHGAVEHPLQLLGGVHVADPHQHLDPAVEVAVHQVGAADPVLRRRRRCAKWKIRECSRKRPTIERTRMFSRQPGHAGPQRADAAHDQVDLHAGLRRPVERVDELLVDQRVHLDPDAGRRRPAAACRSRARSARRRPGRTPCGATSSVR